MIRIDFSSKQVRAALSGVFAAKTYNRLVSFIARKALAVMISIKNAAWGHFPKKSPDAGEENRQLSVNEQKNFLLESTSSVMAEKNDTKTYLQTSRAFLGECLIYTLAKITRQSLNVADLTLEGSKIVFDIIAPSSPRNIGLQTLEQVYRHIRIKGDGHCCFYSMSFGMLHQLLELEPEIRSQKIQELVEGTKKRVDYLLNHSRSDKVKDLAKSINTAEQLAIVEKTLDFFCDLKLEKNSTFLIHWINENPRNLSFIWALRYLTALSGIDLNMQLDVKLLESQLKNGNFGIEAENIEDYIEQICKNESSKNVVYGGDVEIQGFVQLFNLTIETLSLTGIGDHRNAHLTPAEAVERGCMKFPAPNPISEFSPIRLVHSRLHYNAALPLIQKSPLEAICKIAVEQMDATSDDASDSDGETQIIAKNDSSSSLASNSSSSLASNSSSTLADDQTIASENASES